MLKVNDMSYEDMKAYYAEHQLGSYHGIKKDVLREKIEEHQESLIPSEDKPTAPPVVLSQSISDDQSHRVSNKVLTDVEITKAKQKVKLIIHESAEANAINPVFVGVNGYPYVINRGVEVEVPKGVAEALNNARMTVYDRKKDENGNEYLSPREALSYPFSIVG